MTRNTLKHWLLATLALAPLTTLAQPATPDATPPAPKPVNILANRPDADRDAAAVSDAAAASKLLGEPFDNPTAGIRFRPPADTKAVPKNANDAIVDYVNEDKSWLLRVTRYAPPSPVKLTDGVDDKGDPKGGLLAFTAEKQRQANTGGRILRQDVVNVDSNYVGLIVMRFNQGTQRWLRQHAILQVNEQLYYIFTLTTPAGKVPDSVDPATPAAVEEPDPGEKEAVETFNAMVDTIKIVDRAPIKEDQNQRLFRTRALMVYWDEKKLNAMLAPKTYFRIVRDGKDIGYTYVEELADIQEVGGVGIKGIAAYVRAHTEDKDDQGNRTTLDVGSYRFMSYDHRHENWTRATVQQSAGPTGQPTETHATEFGISSWETKRVPSTQTGVGDAKDPRNPLMRPADSHVLEINAWGKDANAEPVRIDLPPFYLPQAGGHFLPRLVTDKAYTEARTYLFASYVPDKRVLMMRYVDVSPELELTFNGKRFNGRTVSERLGLDGTPTIHYVTTDGKYVGSETRLTKTQILPSDEDAIRRIWNNVVNFSRPEKLSGPGDKK